MFTLYSKHSETKQYTDSTAILSKYFSNIFLIGFSLAIFPNSANVMQYWYLVNLWCCQPILGNPKANFIVFSVISFKQTSFLQNNTVSQIYFWKAIRFLWQYHLVSDIENGSDIRKGSKMHRTRCRKYCFVTTVKIIFLWWNMLIENWNYLLIEG